MPPAAPAAELSDPPAQLSGCADLCWALLCAEGGLRHVLEPPVLTSASEEAAVVDPESGKLARCPACMMTTGGTWTGSCMSVKGLPAAKGLWLGSCKEAGKHKVAVVSTGNDAWEPAVLLFKGTVLCMCQERPLLCLLQLAAHY